MKVLRLALFAALSMICAFGQSAEVTVGFGPPRFLWTILNFYDGSSNLQYQCKANTLQPSKTFSVTLGTLTSIAVSSNVGTITWPSGSCGTSNGCGFQISNQIVVSGSATTALNGTYAIASLPTATTATITTSGVSNGTYTDMVITTTAPQSSAPIWTVEKITNTDATPNQVTAIQWAIPSSGVGQSCDNHANLFYQ